MQIATFVLEDVTYGINILYVKEINGFVDVTVVPESIRDVIGLMNLRGQLVTVFDPKILLHKKNEEEECFASLFMIFKTMGEIRPYINKGILENEAIGSDPMAFVVDSVGDVIEIDQSQISLPPANLTGAARKFVSGEIQMDNKLVILLDFPAMIQNYIEVV